MRRFMARLLSGERGNVGLMFGLMLFPMIGIVGLSVDTARAYAVQEQLQTALDAAALAGGRNYSLANRDQIIQDYFNQNWDESRYGALSSPLVITTDVTTGTLTLQANAAFKPIFVKFLGIGDLSVAADAQIVRNDTTLEVALAIDTTGSMGSNDSSGTYKMGAAKDAANLLLNILFNYQDTDDHVYVSVVPFVQNVNVGSNYSNWLVSGSESAVPWNSGPYPTRSGWRGCMFERLNGSGVPVYDMTDESPATQRFLPYQDNYMGPNCPAWTSGERGITPGICRMNNGSLYTASTSGTTGISAPTHTSGTSSDGAVSWTYQLPAYTGGLGTTRINCPIWQRGESVAVNACRTAPICPAWQSGESIAIGSCRTNSGKIYSATSAGTSTGTTGPTHSSGSATTGGNTWQYRGASYTGIGNQVYFATTTGTTGNLAPIHTSTTATSDGSVSWQIAYRMNGGTKEAIGRRWAGSQAISSTGTGNMRSNPWWLYYSPGGTGTTTGSTAPSHVSGSSTSGGISWTYRGRVTAQDPSSSSEYGYGYNSGCGSQIVPLTNNRLTAKARVDVLTPSPYGGTMTNMGLMWGWRTISPNWRGLWSGVPADRPMDNNAADNFKAVIILTDGENTSVTNNNCYNSNAPDNPVCRSANTPYGYLTDGTLGTTTSPSTAVTNMNLKVAQICSNIRASGTLVYAVLFDLPSGTSDTKTLFQNCVGDPSRFFDVVDSAQLSAAFQTIAIDLSRLRISQ